MIARPPARVSLCMIVRNEESNLRPCIEPIRGLVDQVVVIDTGSIDGTRRAAEELGAEVHDFAWCDDFAAARNESLRHATGDWILWLDADDRLDAVNVARLEKLLQGLSSQPADRRVAYMIDTVCLAEHASSEPSVLSHFRLFRRVEGLVWRGRVHEQIARSLDDCGFEKHWTDVQIVHLGYQNSGLLQKKLNRDVRLLRMDYAVYPDDVSVLLHLGLAYLKKGEASQALGYLLQALRHGGRNRSDWMRGVYRAAADALRSLGRPHEALGMTMAGSEQFPDDVDLLFKQADLYYELNDFLASERALKQLLRLEDGPRFQVASQANSRRKVARCELGEVLRVQHRFQEAESVLRGVLVEFPDYTQAWIRLGNVYICQRRWDRLETVWRALEGCPDGAEFALSLRGKACIERGDFDEARRWLEAAIQSTPQMLWPRVLLANLLATVQADLHDCINAQRDVLRLDPGNLAAQEALRQLNDGKRPLVGAAPSTANTQMIVAGIGIETTVVTY